MIKLSLFIFLFLIHASFLSHSPSKLTTLYSSLDPSSIAEHLAFYQLYKETPMGQQALRDACRLLSDHEMNLNMGDLPNLELAIDSIIALVNKQPEAACLVLLPNELEAIDRLAAKLSNRRLKGHFVEKEEDVLQLSAEEIDLSRGILLTQMGSQMDQIRSYEAMLDLMALQILTRINFQSTPYEKIKAITHFIFHEMGYRFPPNSVYAKDIDQYTFLPTVLDSRKGVCLGVSILYLCLAQRLDLKLEMITPPGHIYVRYRERDKEINIETTARGIHLDSEEYLGLETNFLQQRTIKEVIGLAHFNQASVFWQNKEYGKAIDSYQKAERYLPGDPLLTELMAYNHLLIGNVEEGEKLLKKVVSLDTDVTLVQETVPEDYLNGLVSIDAISKLFMRADEKRESLEQKRIALEETISTHPKFRAALFSLAGTWLQLHREREALQTLQKYHALDPSNPTVEYFLTVLHAKRWDYNQAWVHLKQVEKILKEKEYYPDMIKELRKELTARYPE